MDLKDYRFHRRARMSFYQLTPDQQAKVLGTMASLVAVPPSQWPADQAEKLPRDNSLYLVRVDDSLRLYVEPGEGGEQPQVLGIVLEEPADADAQPAHSNGERKMELKDYRFHRRARMMFYQLEPDDQAKVLETMASLVAVPLSQWPADKVKKLRGDDSLYLVWVDDSLRLFVEPGEGEEQPQALDITRHETLQTFAEPAHSTGS